jgi:LemA protein
MKQRKSPVVFIVIAVIVLIGIYMAITYNSLVSKEEKVKLQWNEVQNVYQRRLALIPNLVNVVKGQADFEQTTLQKIAEARNKASQVTFSDNEISSDKYQQQKASQDSLASAANRLILVIEKYPVLKGTDAFAGLQTQLEGTERRVKVARKDFNEAVADYNKSVRGFPSSLVAGILGFNEKNGFEADAGNEKTVEIKFN